MDQNVSLFTVIFNANKLPSFLMRQPYYLYYIRVPEAYGEIGNEYHTYITSTHDSIDQDSVISVVQVTCTSVTG